MRRLSWYELKHPSSLVVLRHLLDMGRFLPWLQTPESRALIWYPLDLIPLSSLVQFFSRGMQQWSSVVQGLKTGVNILFKTHFFSFSTIFCLNNYFLNPYLLRFTAKHSPLPEDVRSAVTVCIPVNTLVTTLHISVVVTTCIIVGWIWQWFPWRRDICLGASQ